MRFEDKLQILERWDPIHGWETREERFMKKNKCMVCGKREYDMNLSGKVDPVCDKCAAEIRTSREASGNTEHLGLGQG